MLLAAVVDWGRGGGVVTGAADLGVAVQRGGGGADVDRGVVGLVAGSENSIFAVNLK